MSAGRLPASETVPVALIEPPPTIAAEARRIVDGVAVDGGVERDVAQPQIGLGVDHLCAGH